MPPLTTSQLEASEDRALVSSIRRERLARRYPGEWVAVSPDWGLLYAHGPSYLTVCETARSAGACDPLVTRLVF